eukprot:514073-Prymnesium_polylepis.2
MCHCRASRAILEARESERSATPPTTDRRTLRASGRTSTTLYPLRPRRRAPCGPLCGAAARRSRPSRRPVQCTVWHRPGRPTNDARTRISQSLAHATPGLPTASADAWAGLPALRARGS